MKYGSRTGIIFCFLVIMLVSLGMVRTQSMIGFGQMQESMRPVPRRGRRTQLPEDFSLEEWNVDLDDKAYPWNQYKQEIPIVMKWFYLLDTVFCMRIWPVLNFIISILIFGRSLFPIWNIIMYIHRSDGEEEDRMPDHWFLCNGSV